MQNARQSSECRTLAFTVQIRHKAAQIDQNPPKWMYISPKSILCSLMHLLVAAPLPRLQASHASGLQLTGLS